jgi:phosphoglycolate phosphatase-like HAD superfamily hydrolase
MTTTPAPTPTPDLAPVLYCLDFDGVLCNSASETAMAGHKAAQILWPQARWLLELEANPIRKQAIQSRFCEIRPCLDSGWEASLLIKLLADDGLSNEEIMTNFQYKLKHKQLDRLGLTKEQCNRALKTARNNWIKLDPKDWLASHDFYEGACDAVKKLLKEQQQGGGGPANSNVYIITTKAAEFAQRLLQNAGLYGEGKITDDHIFGLGTGPKNEVVRELLDKKGKNAFAVLVEDNLLTLHKVMHDDNVCDRVLPVMASWGYNTPVEQKQAMKEDYVVLDPVDSSTIEGALTDAKANKLFTEFKKAQVLKSNKGKK